MKFSIMTREHGHTEEVFDKENIVSMRKAEERFNALARGGRWVELAPGGNKPDRIKKFDRNIEDALFIPAIQGG